MPTHYDQGNKLSDKFLYIDGLSMFTGWAKDDKQRIPSEIDMFTCRVCGISHYAGKVVYHSRTRCDHVVITHESITAYRNGLWLWEYHYGGLSDADTNR